MTSLSAEMTLSQYSCYEQPPPEEGRERESGGGGGGGGGVALYINFIAGPCIVLVSKLKEVSSFHG